MFSAVVLRNCTFKSVTLFLLLSILPATSMAGQSNLRIERNQPSELNDLTITSIGALEFDGDRQAHIDLTYLESDIKGKNSVALDFGGGYVFSGSVALFLGVGISLDYNLDNKKFNDKYYAEAGLIIDLSRELSITARQQHFFHQPDDYEKVIMFGLLFRH